MTKTSDKVVGKAKQVIAEVTGDGQLAEEGKRQEKKPEPKDEPKSGVDTIANNLT